MRLLLKVVGMSLIVSTAMADEIKVSPVIVEMQAGKTMRQDLQVTNHSKHVSYLQVEAYRVKKPGTVHEKNERVSNPQELGLLVTPQKFALNPEASRTVRLALLNPPVNQDLIYRLNVKPIAQKLNASKQEGDQPKLGLRIVVSYGVLVIARPAKLQFDIVISRQGNKVTVVNKGNTAVMLNSGQQCSTANHCADIQGKRINAGASWNFSLPKAAPVNFNASYATINKRLASN